MIVSPFAPNGDSNPSSLLNRVRAELSVGAAGGSGPANHRARFLTVPGRRASFSSMSKLLSGSKNEANAPRLRSWTVALIRNRGPLNHGLQFLGFVEASDAKAAEVAAAKDFGLTNFQCKRLLVQEAGRDH